jgi:predicted N-acyltransferase
VLAISPLSWRGDIALARLSAEDEQVVRDAVIAALQDVAREEKLPLCFFGVQEDKTELRRALAQQGFAELFLVYDHLLHVPGRSFTDYLDQFRSDARRLVNREIKQARDAGVRFELTQDFGRVSARLAELREATYSKHGEDYLNYSAAFWAALERYVAPRAEAIIAYCGRELIGFSLLLNKQQELWFATIGRVYEGDGERAPVYFNLAFYEPVKRALALGAKRIWFGPGASEAKRRRGARGCVLYSFLWFPRRWSRALLMPYLDSYSRVNYRLQRADMRPSSYLKARVADPVSPSELQTSPDATSGSDRTRSRE